MAVTENEVAKEISRNCSELNIGVLALQGDFQKHYDMLLGIEHVTPRVVRKAQEIEDLDGLIIPGGESTTVGKLMVRYGIDEAIKRRVREGMAVYGTCTGMILVASEIEESDQVRLGLMDITVKRNAFGRQVDSFECDLTVPSVCEGEYRCVYIRAPIVTRVGDSVEVLARLDSGEIVLVREGNVLAGAFHPELTDNDSVHRYFAGMVREACEKRA